MWLKISETVQQGIAKKKKQQNSGSEECKKKVKHDTEKVWDKPER